LTHKGLTAKRMKRRIKYEFERAIAAALRRIGLRPDRLILIGLSGGPDSIALANAFLALKDRAVSLNYRLAAAHLNHGLRGAEADRDEAFVRTFCARNTLELVVERAVGLHHRADNLEERARDYRHAFLKRTASRLGAHHIALAHHADDQAETVLLRLMRGSGIAGAAGMAEAGPGLLIRPMIGLRRSEVLAYLEAIGTDYVTDSSNLLGANARSQLRNTLVPMIERDYAPGLAARLSEFASDLRAANDYLTRQSRAELNRRQVGPGRLDLTNFAAIDPALASVLLREFLCTRRGGLRRVNRSHIEGMRSLCVSRSPSGLCTLPGGWRMRREYNEAVIELSEGRDRPSFAVALRAEAITTVAASGFAFAMQASETSGAFLNRKTHRLGMGPMEVLFDASVIGDALVVRNFREGDRIQPLGMDGSRKVQDVFTDRKLPRERRRSWPLVVARGGAIVWIPQMARSRAALVTSATRKVLSLSARMIAPASDAALPRI